MHGLPAMRNESAVEYLLSSFCGMPLVSGDLRNLDEPSVKDINTLCSAYKKLTEQGALTGFEELVLPGKVDGFRRFADDNREFICVFNQGSEAVQLDCLQGFKNVLTGDTNACIAAGSSGMFVKN